MISVAFIVGLAVATLLIAAFWKQLVAFIQKAVQKIREVMRQAPEGIRTFITRIDGVLKNKSMVYVKNDALGAYQEVQFTSPVTNEKDIPKSLRRKALALTNGQQMGTTNEFRMAINAPAM